MAPKKTTRTKKRRTQQKDFQKGTHLGGSKFERTSARGQTGVRGKNHGGTNEAGGNRPRTSTGIGSQQGKRNSG
jgi:hypothetical protein